MSVDNKTAQRVIDTARMVADRSKDRGDRFEVAEDLMVSMSLALDEYDTSVTVQAPADPLDTLLPCDITVGHVTIGKGCPLRALVHRMQALYWLANGVLRIDCASIDRAMSMPPDDGEGAAS